MATTAQGLATVADDVFRMMELLRDPNRIGRFPERPPLKQWLKMYRRHKSVAATAMNKLSRSSKGTRFMDEYRWWQPFAHALRTDEAGVKAAINAGLSHVKPKVFWREFRRCLRQVQKEYRKHLTELRIDLEDDPFEIRDDVETVLRRCAEVQFMLEVFLPCVILHEAMPGRLLRRARRRDATAIEQLVRLDGQVIHDPKIAQWANSGSGSVRKGRTHLIGEWLKNPTRGEVTKRGLKQSLAGLISLYSVGAAFRYDAQWKPRRYTLTAPQIRALFDAVARDRGEATIAGKDPDIAMCTDGAWAKAVSRYRATWATGLKLDLDKYSAD